MIELLVLTVVLVSFHVPDSDCNPDAKRLYDDLLSNYNRLIRPVSNNTDTVLVKLGLRLSQLIELVRNVISCKSDAQVCGHASHHLNLFVLVLDSPTRKTFGVVNSYLIDASYFNMTEAYYMHFTNQGR